MIKEVISIKKARKRTQNNERIKYYKLIEEVNKEIQEQCSQGYPCGRIFVRFTSIKLKKELYSHLISKGYGVTLVLDTNDLNVWEKTELYKKYPNMSREYFSEKPIEEKFRLCTHFEISWD